MAKYGNRKVIAAGKVYDSAKEARRHKELLLLERAGAITDLQTQVKFVLIPAQRADPEGNQKKGQLIERECAYYADFVYHENGRQVVEDTKGIRTKDYIIKRKLMLYVHGIRILET